MRTEEKHHYSRFELQPQATSRCPKAAPAMKRLSGAFRTEARIFPRPWFITVTFTSSITMACCAALNLRPGARCMRKDWGQILRARLRWLRLMARFTARRKRASYTWSKPGQRWRCWRRIRWGSLAWQPPQFHRAYFIFALLEA